MISLEISRIFKQYGTLSKIIIGLLIIIRQGKVDDFVKILDTSLRSADTQYDGMEKDQMRAYDTLAAHYVQVRTKNSLTNKNNK